MWSRVRAIVLAACVALGSIVLHESGHALGAYASGASVRSFSIVSLRPHVRVHGHKSLEAKAVTAVAGSAVFAAGWFLLVLFGRRRSGLQVPIRVATAFAVAEGIAWVASAALYPHVPANYDPVKFIALSHANQWLVLLVSSTVMAAGAWLVTRPSPDALPHL